MNAPQYGKGNGKRLTAPQPPKETFAKDVLVKGTLKEIRYVKVNRPKRDKPKSRNDRRVYHWALGMSRADFSGRF
jgi:hypothetical protein